MNQQIHIIKCNKQRVYLNFFFELSLLNFKISNFLLLYLIDYNNNNRYCFGFYLKEIKNHIVIYNLKDNFLLKINLYNPYCFFLINF